MNEYVLDSVVFISTIRIDSRGNDKIVWIRSEYKTFDALTGRKMANAVMVGQAYSLESRLNIKYIRFAYVHNTIDYKSKIE